MSQSKNWCFTLNNPTNEETEHLLSLEDNALVKYIVYQLEAGVVGTSHFQGYVQFSKRVRLSQVKAAISARSHVERAMGTPQQNKDYCTKEPRNDGPWEFGEMSIAGKRNDIKEFVKDMQLQCMTEAEVFERHPLILAKYPRFVATARRLTAESRVADPPLATRPGWQESLLRYLSTDPDPRKVCWYYDEVGGAGKSIFSRRFRCGDGSRAYVVTGGRHGDIQYGYARQPVIFFDWPRSGQETFPYGVVEAFKNGYFLNTKYESVPFYFNSPHVIVFSNFYPDKTKLSLDRWDIHTIDNSLLRLPPLSLPPPQIL